MVATILSTAVDTRISIAGGAFCYGKFISQSTVETIRNDEILCGHVDPEVEGDAEGRELNKFVLLFDITAPFLQAILPYIGAVADDTAFVADLSLDSFALAVDMGAAVHTYAETWIDKMILRGGTSTMPISCELHCVAVQEADGSFGSPTEDIDFIYGFPGSTLSVAGTSYDIDRFAIAIERNLVFEWNSSNLITGVGRGKRRTMCAFSTPYLAAKKTLYWSNKTYLLGRALVLGMTNGDMDIAFSMPKGRLNPKTPSIDSLTESIRLDQTWEARRKNGTPDVEAFSFDITATP
jgi:hypothetical protein